MSTKSKTPTGKVAQTITAVKNIAKRLTAGKTVEKKDKPATPVKKTAARTKPVNAKSTSKPANPKPSSKPVSAKPATPASKKPIRTVPAIPGKVASGETNTIAPRFSIFDEEKRAFIPIPGAKRISVPGFDWLQLFLHKGANDFRISEACSGALLATGNKQKVAIQMATSLLNKHGKPTILAKIQEAVNRTGVAPGFAPPDGVRAPDKPGKDEPKEEFTVTTDDGKEIKVTYTPGFMQHLEFRGEISPTGYHSHFGYKGKPADIQEAARKHANELREAFMKDQIRQARKAKPTGDAAASQKNQPAQTPLQATASADGRGGKPRGKMSLLDAAADVLKESNEPLCCKDIIREIFERKLAESSGRTPQATLSAAIGREISARGKDSRFKRAERGQYTVNS